MSDRAAHAGGQSLSNGHGQLLHTVCVGGLVRIDEADVAGGFVDDLPSLGIVGVEEVRLLWEGRRSEPHNTAFWQVTDHSHANTIYKLRHLGRKMAEEKVGDGGGGF